MYNPLWYLVQKYPDKFQNIIYRPHALYMNLDIIKKYDLLPRTRYKSYMSLNIETLWKFNIKKKYAKEIIKEYSNILWEIHGKGIMIYNNSGSTIPIDNLNITTVDILKKYPMERWVWGSLSRSVYIPFNDINNNLLFPWDWSNVTINPNVTMEIIENNPKVPWNYKKLILNPNITLDFIKKNLDKPWKFKKFHGDINIALWIYDNYPNHDLRVKNISKCKGITLDIIKQYHNIEWSWTKISKKINISLNEFDTELPWDWIALSKNHHINQEFIETYADKPWNWKSFSSNSKLLTIEFIIKFRNRGWDWNKISRYINITIEILETYPDLPWSWQHLSSNKQISLEIIEKNIDKNWDYDTITYNDFIPDNRLHSRNIIYNCWKKRKIRFKMKHQKLLKRVNLELRALPPLCNFGGGADYIIAFERFNKKN